MSEINLTPAEERVKKYLEEQIQNDEALRTLYAPSKIKDCYQYITAEAEKKASLGSYFANDVEVWKWARDYFIEVLPKKAEKMPVEVASKKVDAMPGAQSGGEEKSENQETAAETEQITEKESADNKNIVTDEYGFEVFGEEPEEAETPAETEQITQSDPVTETEQATDKAESADNENDGTPREEAETNQIQYDDDGNGLLFDFDEIEPESKPAKWVDE